jgi:hypothetical protein
MKRRSFETYQSSARKHLLPALGSAKLRELNREHVQRCTLASAMLASPLTGYAGFTVSYRQRSTRS